MAREPAKTTDRKGRKPGPKPKTTPQRPRRKPGPKPGAKTRRQAESVTPLSLEQEPPQSTSKSRLFDLIEALQLTLQNAQWEAQELNETLLKRNAEIEKLKKDLAASEDKRDEIAGQLDEEQERLSQFGLMLGDKEWKLNYAGR